MPGIFHSRHEKALRVAAGPEVVDGRLQGRIAFELHDLANPGDKRSPEAKFELFGPGDVARLAPGAITRRYPAPGASDAEETKLPLVEFRAVDLPWRYTPEAAVGARLRPWLVLVVGHRAPDEIVLRPDGRVTLGVTVQGRYDLASSWQWAHVHEVDIKQIGRIVSPVDLVELNDYVAVLVPAFTADGSDAWSGAATVTLDCYDRWSFRTGPHGDFPWLAEQLRKATLVEDFGRAEVAWTPRTVLPTAVAPTVLPTGGALRLPADPDPPVPAAVAAEVAALSERIVTPDGRGVVTAPRYEEPFTAEAAQGWISDLREDFRARGAAGLGAWTAIAWQDRISAAAATKAGDLAIAADRVRHVALGVEASRSLWRRRVPVEAPARLAVLSPVLGRLAALPDPGEPGAFVSALDRMTGGTSQFGRALLSSAARRAFRPGPARTARARPSTYPDALVAANDCPREEDDPADIRPRHQDPEEAVKAAVAQATGDEDLTAKILDHLDRVGRSEGALVALFEALAQGEDLDDWFRRREYPQPDDELTTWWRWMDEVAPPGPCRPIDLAGVTAVVSDAVDPTGPRPPAVVRVLATLPGIATIAPVEIEPELDLPLWSFLSENSPDWMLPGAGDLKEHDVVGLSTNPAFVQALLVGANQQAAAELRWRNVPMTTRWSPLRKFWQRTGGEFDIVPVKNWANTGSLGSVAFSATGLGAEAVVAFRTPLFRRYPATVVYLYQADPLFTAPLADVPLEKALRVGPSFTGTIGPDITFFGFPVSPDELKDHWVVLEEPPAGYRFFSENQHPLPFLDDNASSATYAYNRFAPPVRVLIGPLL